MRRGCSVNTWRAAFHVAVGCALCACSQPPDAASFVIRNVQWTRTEYGTSPVLGTHVSFDVKAELAGPDSSGTPYLVLLDFVRARRVNADDPVDTIPMFAVYVGRPVVLAGQDYAFGCLAQQREYRRLGITQVCTDSIREPADTFVIRGYIRLTSPASPSSGAL